MISKILKFRVFLEPAWRILVAYDPYIEMHKKKIPEALKVSKIPRKVVGNLGCWGPQTSRNSLVNQLNSLKTNNEFDTSFIYPDSGAANCKKATKGHNALFFDRKK